MIRTHRLAVWLAASLSGAPALADDPAGMVKVSKGQVSIERAGAKLAAAVGTPVLVSDRLRTGGTVRSASRCATTRCSRPGRTR